MTIKAVLFDFSGTLFRFQHRDDWFADLHDEDGRPLHLEAQAEIMRRMTRPVGLSVDLAPDDVTAWQQRDLDPGLHRKAYLAILRASGLSVPGHAEALYARLSDTDSWVPFLDTVEVIRGIKAAGLPVGIVSNIPFDLRPIFARHGIGDLIDAYALSFEVGVIKPDPTIFHAALDPIGVAPSDALMVGDSEEADGGARELGAAFELVVDEAPELRPRALLDAVGKHSIQLA